MQKRKKRYIIIIIILVCIIFYMINSMKYNFLQEDVIFFQFLNSKNQSRGISNTKKEIVEEIKKEETTVNTKTIFFHVQYKNTKMKAINLTDTVDNETLVYEKIALNNLLAECKTNNIQFLTKPIKLTNSNKQNNYFSIF